MKVWSECVGSWKRLRGIEREGRSGLWICRALHGGSLKTRNSAKKGRWSCRGGSRAARNWCAASSAPTPRIFTEAILIQSPCRAPTLQDERHFLCAASFPRTSGNGSRILELGLLAFPRDQTSYGSQNQIPRGHRCQHIFEAS